MKYDDEREMDEWLEMVANGTVPGWETVDVMRAMLRECIRRREIVVAAARKAWLHDDVGDAKRTALRSLELVGITLSHYELDALEGDAGALGRDANGEPIEPEAFRGAKRLSEIGEP